MDMEIIIILVLFVCNIVLLICGIRLWLNCKDYRTTLNLVLNYLDMAMSEKFMMKKLSQQFRRN
jgi:hypothetical protein